MPTSVKVFLPNHFLRSARRHVQLQGSKLFMGLIQTSIIMRKNERLSFGNPNARNEGEAPGVRCSLFGTQNA